MADDFQLFTSLRFDLSLLPVPATDFKHAGWNYEKSSPLYMFDLHRDRILRAATHWGWQKAIDVLKDDAGLETLSQAIIAKCGTGRVGPYRVKLLASKEGTLEVQTSVVPAVRLQDLFPEKLPEPGSPGPGDNGVCVPRKESEFSMLVDVHKTSKSEFTHFKTTNRAMYDQARERAVISLADRKEVLLVNDTDGSVMEGSLTTPYLWRDGRWVTPPVSPKYSTGDSGGQDGTTRRWALQRGMVVEADIKADSLVDGEECWVSNGVKGFVFGRIKLL